MAKIDLRINGASRRIDTDADRSLLSVLRDDLDLTGAKYGCGEGQCGACTVLVNGRATRSCITQIGTLSGKQITTIEGLEQKGTLHPIQDAFIEAGAMQCGYCIPGMIMSGAGLLKNNPRPSAKDILAAMEGNICRCGTYARILAALTRGASVGTGSVPARGQVGAGLVPARGQVGAGLVPADDQVGAGLVHARGQVGAGLVPARGQVGAGLVPARGQKRGGSK